MPKARHDTQPYDPIAADLVRDVAAAGRTRSPAKSPLHLAPVVTTPSEPTITKRFQLTRSEDAELNAFLLRLQGAAGSKVALSVIVRAMLAVVMESEPRLIALVTERRLRLPSTHDRLALGQYEEEWRSCLGAGFRK